MLNERQKQRKARQMLQLGLSCCNSLASFKLQMGLVCATTARYAVSTNNANRVAGSKSYPKTFVSLASLNHGAIEHQLGTHIELKTRQCLSDRQIVVKGVEEREREGERERKLEEEKGKRYCYTV